MKSVIVSLVAIAGMSLGAHAEVNTRIELLLSVNGGPFSANIFSPSPGDHVEVLVRATYIGSAAPIGFASANFQITAQNFTTADTMDAFASGGFGSNFSSPLGVVADAPGQYGRISPWGRTNLSSANAITAFNNNSGGQPAGSWLRIAQKQITAWIGGPGNTTGNSGINLAQLSNVGRTTSDPAFNPSLSVNLFRFGFTMAGSISAREMVFDIPLDGFGNRNSVTGEREVYWFANMNEGTGSITGTAVVIPARTFLPTPASLVVLGLGGLAIGRRRR